MSLEDPAPLHYEESTSSLVVSTGAGEEAFRVVASESAYEVAWISISEKSHFLAVAFAVPEIKASLPRITDDTPDSLRIRCGQITVACSVNSYNPPDHNEISVIGRGIARIDLIKRLLASTIAPSIALEQSEFLNEGLYRHLPSPALEAAAIVG